MSFPVIIVTILQGRYCYARFTNEENKAQGGKLGSTLLLYLSSSPSSGTTSPLLTISHIPALFMACLLQQPPHIWPSGIPLFHALDLLPLPFSAYHSVPTMIHNPHHNNHLLNTYHVLGTDLRAPRILPHFISMRAPKVGIVNLILM